MEDIENLWRPALSHPDAPEIINAVLSHWFNDYLADPRVKESFARSYDFPLNLSAVRAKKYQLPKSFVPKVEGVTFGDDGAKVEHPAGRRKS